MSENATAATPLRVVGRDVAADEFDRFCRSMDLDVDTTRMTEDDLKSFENARHAIVRAIEGGSLVIDEKGQPTYTPVVSDDRSPITFFEPTGASFMSMDTQKKGADVAKMFAMLADITRTDASRFAKMKGRDLKVCRTLLTLFLG